jgi:predicted kinase
MLPRVPTAPGWAFDWDALDEAYTWVRALRGVAQDPVHHAEGDVWTHTRMVCERLVEQPSWRSLSSSDRRVSFWAALLHDVSKPQCTREEGGRITARGHSSRGEVVARVVLWRLGASPTEREQVAQIIRYHQIPYFALERERPHDLLIRISQTTRCDLLALVAEADARGRVCADQQRLLDSVALFSELALEIGCLTHPFQFASAVSRFEWFRSPGRDPQYAAHDSTRFDVTLLSGLPGAGKDRWRAAHAGSFEVVSLDEIRRRLGVDPREDQASVIEHARQHARELLRQERPFAWNATNLSRRIRGPLIGLFADYGARVTIAYREAPCSVLYAQNAARENPVAEQVLESMLGRWEVPDLTEAHDVNWV